MNILTSKSFKIFGLSVSYWGLSQWYKFRWNITHIDLGVISIYDLPQKGFGRFFWRCISILIKPLRVWYHRRYVYSVKAQIKNEEWKMNHFRRDDLL